MGNGYKKRNKGKTREEERLQIPNVCVNWIRAWEMVTRENKCFPSSLCAPGHGKDFHCDDEKYPQALPDILFKL